MKAETGGWLVTVAGGKSNINSKANIESLCKYAMNWRGYEVLSRFDCVGRGD
jgi:hypothetical protein